MAENSNSEFYTSKPPQRPFKIAILGDFSGKGTRSVNESSSPWYNREIISIDSENFYSVFERLSIEVHLPFGDQDDRVELKFKDMDDFHPANICLKEPGLIKLIRAKKELKTREEDNHTDVVENLLGIGRQKQNKLELSAADLSIQSMIESAVNPHLKEEDSPGQKNIKEQINQVLSDNLKALLHHPSFQALESSWQSLYFLVSNLNLNSKLQIFLIDVTRAELEQDLRDTDNYQKTRLFKLLEKPTSGTMGETPFSLITGDFIFAYNNNDIPLLSTLGEICGSFGARFITGASSDFIGCSSLHETPDPDDWNKISDSPIDSAWEKLRRSPEALHISLVLPRYMARLPWTRNPEYDEQEFEEITEHSDHLEYLWGNAAYLVTFLRARTFEKNGWQVQNTTEKRIEGMPFHVFKSAGKEIVKTSGEVVLTDRAIARILERGLIPLQCSPNEDTLDIESIISIAFKG